MKITITGRKVSLRDNFKERVEKKLKKFGRMFGEDASASVTVTVEKRRQTVEVTIRTADGMVYRSEQTAPEMNDALDEVVNALGRQIRKNKTKIAKKHREKLPASQIFTSEFEAEPVEEGPAVNVVRTKHVSLKPMDLDEALLQMDLLGHDFFIYTDAEDGVTNILYRREDGELGLIEAK